MKEKSQIKKDQQHNPYEKVFDDANRLLNQFGDMGYLDNIPDDNENKKSSIPFPYGNNSLRPYNFNLK